MQQRINVNNKLTIIHLFINKVLMTQKILSLSFFFVSLTLMSTPVLAEKTIAECEKSSENPKHLSRCFDTLKTGLERELQTWINNHVFNLEEKSRSTGRYSALKMFKQSQNDFITFRDNNCRWQYLAISPDKGADLAYKKCYILATQNRIDELSKIP
jgi:uncharacterized protein YecT (DUF1311 family)